MLFDTSLASARLDRHPITGVNHPFTNLERRDLARRSRDQGIDRHIEDLKALFVFAPDITIKVHPVRFGSGTWTAVTGVMTGTFTLHGFVGASQGRSHFVSGGATR